jgi:hypothetical protein
MELREIKALAGLQPLFDPVFQHLLESALAGRVDVYFAAVPLASIQPFDPDYAPRRHPVGEAAVRDVVRSWRAGKVQPMWVYQKDQHFVMSDDYIVWEAVKEGQPDYVPCCILGRPDHPSITDLQGPLDQPSIRKALGFNP